MPRYIIKPKADEDFYVAYSTVVDSPCESGSRAEMSHIAAERLDRADEYGTSAQWGEPPVYGWDDQKITVREGIIDPTRPERSFYGEVKRGDLRAFCESLQEDGYFHPLAGLVTWITAEAGTR